MSNRFLQYGEWVGGPGTAIYLGAYPYCRQNIPVEIRSPLTNTPIDITGATLKTDFRSYVLNEISWSRTLPGEIPQPNFTNTQALGSINNYTHVTDLNDVPEVLDGPNGLIEFIAPANRYKGPLLPDNRTNVVLTQFTLQITLNPGTRAATSFGLNLGLIETYEPRDESDPDQITPGDVSFGSPLTYSLYQPQP